MDILNSYLLKPIIKQPTRSSSCIDNICINVDTLNYNAAVVNNNISDHFAQVLTLYCQKSEQPPKISYQYRDLYNKTNNKHFLTMLSQETWEHIYQASGNVNERFDTFLQTFQYYIDVAFPLKTKIIGRHKVRKPWITKGILVSNDRLHYLYKLSKAGDIFLKDYYRSYKRVYARVLRAAKRLYYNKLIINAKNQTRSAWKVIKQNKNSSRQETISLKIEDTLVTEPKDVAHKFMQHFNSFSELHQDNSTINSRSHIDRNNHSFYFRPVIASDIISIINTLSTSNSTGADRISTNMLKMCSTLISQPLAFLINCSIEEGIFPDKMKIAKIKPLFKSGDKFDIGNFRPISLLSPFSKVFEKYVSLQLINFFDTFSLFNSKQFGFRKGMSTKKAVLHFLDDLYLNMDKGEKCVGIFLDLSKAFDLVDHAILLDKLDRYGIRGKPFNWFHSYLYDRKHYVEVDNVQSEQHSYNIGVPQGSILGPLLYIIYVNDFPSDCSVMYADDTSLLISGKNLKSVVEQANSSLSDAQQWYISNRLVVNPKKSVYLRFNYSNVKIDHSLLIKSAGKSIMQVETTKFLGIYISQNCKWDTHIEKTCQKIAPLCYCLYQLSFIVEKWILLMFYYAQIHSVLSYGIEAWGASSKIQRLFRIQKRAIRAIAGVGRRTSCRNLFKSFEILTLPSVYIMNTLLHAKTHMNLFNTLNSGIYNTMKSLPLAKFKKFVHQILITKVFYSVEEFLSCDCLI
nr:unnamed protein product [Callosobruchus chinensis]